MNELKEITDKFVPKTRHGWVFTCEDIDAFLVKEIKLPTVRARTFAEPRTYSQLDVVLYDVLKIPPSHRLLK